MDGPTDATLEAYQRSVAEYCATSPDAVTRPVAHLLDAVLERVPPHGSVLEIGTGPGLEATYLEQRGLMVERTDATPGFVERLRAQGHDARQLEATGKPGAMRRSGDPAGSSTGESRSFAKF